MAPFPSRLDGMAFQGKAALLRARRMWVNRRNGALAENIRFDSFPGAKLLAESKSPLWDRDAAASEQFLQRGKVENLRIAARRLDLCVVPAESIFSFWKLVGRPSRRRGYVRGRELRQGCLVPSTGGGLCQLSNALYDAALRAGFRVVERHRHSQVVPGSLAEIGRDATVFWNYIDLRFSAPGPFQVRVLLTPEELVVQFWGEAA